MGEENKSDSIAIIGMAGRFPGANSVEELWDVLREGRETISHFSKETLEKHEFDKEALKNDHYVGARGVLDTIELFDAGFFNYSPREAAFTDPQQRIWLEVAWEALEQAGYARPDDNCLVGVYTGYSNSTYLLHNLLRNRLDSENYVCSRYGDDFSFMLANTPAYIATRTAYKFNLKGPAITVQTACSTSLVAVVMAIQSLLQYESDVCIAGGVTISVPQIRGYIHHEGMILSKDGHCRPFDADASGMVWGSGAGAVILKRLDEAIDHHDHILAVIRSGAINNDGAGKIAYTAPSIEGQAKVITTAHYQADIDPETITYIEAHGTGTALGDPAEIAGLKKAFGEFDVPKPFCGVGSIKSNIGHLDAAAGIAGLIKVVLALQHRQLPATVHFKKPNPNIDLKNTPFYIVEKLQDWPSADTPRRAGVSSFGIGGTNAHVVVEEAPSRFSSGPSREQQLLLISAKSDDSLQQMISRLTTTFNEESGLCLADAAWTLHKTRKEYDRRFYIVCDNNPGAAATALQMKLMPFSGMKQAPKTRPRLVFGFPGQGSHYYGMGSTLKIHEHHFRMNLEQCCHYANRHIDIDLMSMFSNATTEEQYNCRMSHNGIAQLAAFSFNYSLAQLWQSWGVVPAVVTGHSLGEWCAACFAGILTLEQTIEAVWHRGCLMQSVAGDGAAIAVFAGPDSIQPFIGEDVYIAGYDAPSLTVLSGTKSSIGTCKTRLDGRKINYFDLTIEVAVHSPLLDPIIEPFENILKHFDFKPPTVPVIATATGNWLQTEEAVSPAFWARQMRQPVRFSSAIKTLRESGSYCLLETGPGTALCSLHKQQGGDSDAAVPSLTAGISHDEQKALLTAAGELWLNGIQLDADLFFAGEKRQTVPLPTYCFTRKRYWIDPSEMHSDRHRVSPDRNSAGTSENVSPNAPRHTEKEKRPALAATYIAPRNELEKKLAEIWSDILGVAPVGVKDRFGELGGESLTAVRLMESIRAATGKSIPLSVLETAPTIEQLSPVIKSSEKKNNDFISLIPVKNVNNSKRPILFVSHSVGGEVHWGYLNITAGFNDEQPIWGFEQPDEKYISSIESMASLYLSEMKMLQPEGPYYLAGYCFGGIIVYEIARQLRENGDEVNFLGLIECTPVNTGFGKITVSPQYIKGFIRNVPLFIADFIHRSSEDRKNAVSRYLSRWQRVSLSFIKQLVVKSPDKIVKLKKERTVTVKDIAGTTENLSEVTVYRWSKNLERLQQYTSRPVDIPLEVFRTARQPFLSPHDPTMGWGSLTNKGVTAHVLPGGHFTMMNQENAMKLGQVLFERLRRAQGM